MYVRSMSKNPEFHTLHTHSYSCPAQAFVSEKLFPERLGFCCSQIEMPPPADQLLYVVMISSSVILSVLVEVASTDMRRRRRQARFLLADTNPCLSTVKARLLSTPRLLKA